MTTFDKAFKKVYLYALGAFLIGATVVFFFTQIVVLAIVCGCGLLLMNLGTDGSKWKIVSPIQRQPKPGLPQQQPAQPPTLPVHLPERPAIPPPLEFYDEVEVGAEVSVRKTFGTMLGSWSKNLTISDLEAQLRKLNRRKPK